MSLEAGELQPTLLERCAMRMLSLVLVSLIACSGCHRPTQESLRGPNADTASTGASRDNSDPVDAGTQRSKSDPHAASRVNKDHQKQSAATGGGKTVNEPGQSLDERMLFFPARYPEGDWNPRDVEYEDLFFRADDGTRLHAWYCRCERPRAVVLYAHGNAGNLTHRAEVLRRLTRQLRVTVLIFDYRGYGRSEGTPTVEGVLSDARAAREALAKRAEVEQQEVVLMGRSLGGAIAVQLAAESPARALVLESTFSSLKDVGVEHFGMLAVLVSDQKLNGSAVIARHAGPLLQSHGNADRTIPYALGEKLFQAANEPKRFVTIAGADHNDPQSAEYYKELDAFIAALAER